MIYSKIHYRLINNLSERGELKKLVENKVEYFFWFQKRETFLIHNSKCRTLKGNIYNGDTLSVLDQSNK